MKNNKRGGMLTSVRQLSLAQAVRLGESVQNVRKDIRGGTQMEDAIRWQIQSRIIPKSWEQLLRDLVPVGILAERASREDTLDYQFRLESARKRLPGHRE